MKKLAFITLAVIMVLGACNTGNKKQTETMNPENVKEWTDEQINKWFEDSKWNIELTMKPDASTDKRQFVEQNVLNPEAWDAAFRFFKENDLKTLTLGRHELGANGVYVNVEEYTTKDSSHFEAHRKFIDIQCLAFGEEYIWVAPYDSVKHVQVTPFNVEKDIEFFDTEGYEKRLLNQANCLILFPSDAHQPCMKANKNTPVRKVVAKIPLVQ